MRSCPIDRRSCSRAKEAFKVDGEPLGGWRSFLMTGVAVLLAKKLSGYLGELLRWMSWWPDKLYCRLKKFFAV
jgi:hypothetical protein